MAEDLVSELAELLSVDVAEVPVMALRERTARLQRLLSRVQALALRELAAFEESQAWRLDSSYGVANWLQGHVGTSRSDAGRQVRLARHLAAMPATSAALERGFITVEHARVLARCVANPRARAEFSWAENRLVDTARQVSADELAGEVDKFLAYVDQDGPEPPAPQEDQLYANRVGDRVKIDGDLGLDAGLPLLAALQERTEQLYRRDQEVTSANPNDPLAARTPANRRAEALTELVLAGSGSESNPLRREPLLNVHVDHLTLARLQMRQDSLSELDDGTVIPMPTLATWRCECAVSRVVLDAREVLLSYGRTERYANRQLRRALVARDRGCAVPGCDRPPELCDAHHIVFWDDDGPTDLDNLVLLCRHHHRMIHAAELRVEMVDGRPRFYDSFGALLEKGRWRPPEAHAA